MNIFSHQHKFTPSSVVHPPSLGHIPSVYMRMLRLTFLKCWLEDVGNGGVVGKRRKMQHYDWCLLVWGTNGVYIDFLRHPSSVLRTKLLRLHSFTSTCRPPELPRRRTGEASVWPKNEWKEYRTVHTEWGVIERRPKRLSLSIFNTSISRFCREWNSFWVLSISPKSGCQSDILRFYLWENHVGREREGGREKGGEERFIEWATGRKTERDALTCVHLGTIF